MDNSTLKRSPNGDCILTLYTEQNEQMTYTINKSKIIFTMYDVAVVLLKKEGWIVDDIICKDQPMIGVLSLLGTVRMITHYNIDIAYRWFERTKQTAISLAQEDD